MQSLPPLPAAHIHIADDAPNHSISEGTGAYAQQHRWEKAGLSTSSTQEKEIEEEDDVRDVRKKQV